MLPDSYSKGPQLKSTFAPTAVVAAKPSTDTLANWYQTLSPPLLKTRPMTTPSGSMVGAMMTGKGSGHRNAVAAKQSTVLPALYIPTSMKLSQSKLVRLGSFEVLAGGPSATFEDTTRLNGGLVKRGSDMPDEALDYSRTYRGMAKTGADFTETDVDLSNLYGDVIKTGDQLDDVGQDRG